eukprot:62961-Pelagomonas_calceolata.AAC.1
MSELLNLLLAGLDQPQADQTNSLAEGSLGPSRLSTKDESLAGETFKSKSSFTCPENNQTCRTNDMEAKFLAASFVLQGQVSS